jgi:hypothetical protein
MQIHDNEAAHHQPIPNCLEYRRSGADAFKQA